MKLFDPDFSELSTEMLAEVDRLCGAYESQRTRGEMVFIEEFLTTAVPKIRLPLRLELIRVEMEILDAWDQLATPERLVERFPDLAEFIKAQWKVLKTRSNSRSPLQAIQDTRAHAASGVKTHDDRSTKISAPQGETELPLTEGDPSPRFHIIRNLAQGGIGTIFVAFDRDLQREVAIKELKSKFVHEPAAVRLFEAEATVTGNLEHPNIVPIYATGVRSDGRPYYAMRLIRGQSMQVAISELHCQAGLQLDFRKNATARGLLFHFITVCRAIGFAHSRGVLHRDLKPSNMMVGGFGETLVVDWGLARSLSATSPPERTSSLLATATQPDFNGIPSVNVVGTPGYMSPEQALGRNQELSVASDIYSLGATLFHLLTNRVPPGHTGVLSQKPNQADASSHQVAQPMVSGVDIEQAQNHSHELSLNQFGTFPAALDAICGKAMKHDPLARYSSAELLAADLEAWLADEPVSVLVESRFQKIRRWTRSHPTLAGAGLSSILITLLAMAITLSILSTKNNSLREANARQQKSAREALANAADAAQHAAEAVRQRQRVLGILNTFLTDVQRGLANVPGGAAVQKNVLSTVLNKLGEVSSEFGDAHNADVSNALALIDLGDLFARVGTQDIQLDLTLWNQPTTSPLEAASLMYVEAMKVAQRLESAEDLESRRILSVIQLKQAEILRQTARTQEALELLEATLLTRRMLLAEVPESRDAAIEVVTAVDAVGRIHLQSGDFAQARMAFGESRDILQRLTVQFPQDNEIKRLLGIALSRIADIAVQEGDLDTAASLYGQDLAISRELYLQQPNEATAKRDLCISLDRIGNMLVKRGQIEPSMDVFLESRRLREELHTAEPSDIKAAQDLMVSYMKGGDTRMLLKDVASAQLDYQKALKLADELAQNDPQNAIARRFQSISAEVLADVAISQSQLDDALRYAIQSLDISLELAAKDPTDGQTQRDLYICYLKVAKVYLARQDYDACLQQLGLALNITKLAYEQEPESLRAVTDYNAVRLRIAIAQLEAGDPKSAVKELETVISIHEAIPESNRQDATSRRLLANTYTMLGRALKAEGQKEQALRALDHARELTNAMIEEDIRTAQMQLDLIDIEALISALTHPTDSQLELGR